MYIVFFFDVNVEINDKYKCVNFKFKVLKDVYILLFMVMYMLLYMLKLFCVY